MSEKRLHKPMLTWVRCRNCQIASTAIRNSLEANKKIGNLSKEIEGIKNKPHRNYRTEKYSYQNKKFIGSAHLQSGDDSR